MTRFANIFGRDIVLWEDQCCYDKAKPDTRTLYIELTRNCTCTCPICFNANAENDLEVDINSLKETLDELIINTKIVDRVSITGGEPLMYSNLKGLCDLLDSYENLDYYAITTNSVFLKEKLHILEASTKLAYINISRMSDNDDLNTSIFNSSIGAPIGIQELIDIATKSSKSFRVCHVAGLSFKIDDDYVKMISSHMDVLFRLDYNLDPATARTIFDRLHSNICNYPECDVYIKQSDKCKCIVRKCNDHTIEIRYVDVLEEQHIEEWHKYVRNLIYMADDTLRCGWSKNAIILNNR